MAMPTNRTPAKKTVTKKKAAKKSAAKKTVAKKSTAKKASSPSKPLPKISDLEAVAKRVEVLKEQGKTSAGSTQVVDLAKAWDSLVKWFKKLVGQK